MKLVASNPWSPRAIGAAGFFERQYRGEVSLPRTPLYKDLSTDEVFNRWIEILKRHEAKYPKTVEYDLTRLSRVGPRGGYPPLKERKQDLELYASRLQKPDLDPSILKEAVRMTREYIQVDNVSGWRPLSLKSVLKRDTMEEKLDSNSGVPDFSKRTIPEVQLAALADAEQEKCFNHRYPFIVAQRVQRHAKPRFIFMAPMSLNLKEKTYLLPLMDHIRSLRKEAFLAWEGFEHVESVIPKGEKEYVTTDFVGMDQTVGPAQAEIFLDVFKGVFQDEIDFRRTVLYCFAAPIQVEYFNAWDPGVHSLPSGAGWTNFIETVLATVMHFYTAIYRGESHRFQVLGDDGVSFSSPGLSEALVTVSKHFGFEMHPDKQRVSDFDYVYLQRYFNPKELGPVGAYPTIRAIDGCLHPERFHDPRRWGPRMESLRWIMILENCKHHPAFEDLIDFVKNGDKYSLDLGSDAESVYQSAKAIGGFVPSYNQASSTRNLADFEVMKYLSQQS